MANGICCEAQMKGPLTESLHVLLCIAFGAVVFGVCEWMVNKATGRHVFAAHGLTETGHGREKLLR